MKLNKLNKTCATGGGLLHTCNAHAGDRPPPAIFLHVAPVEIENGGMK